MKIVLIEPEIPQNTGNIGRLISALGWELVLVGKLGFSLDEKSIRRSGMDYWNNLNVSRMEINDFMETVTDRTAFISTKGQKNYTEINKTVDTLVFGNESSGLPGEIYAKYPQLLYRIPMKEGTRSINLATSAGIVAYHMASLYNFSDLI